MFYSKEESLFAEMQAQSMRKKNLEMDSLSPKTTPPPAMPSLSSAWF